MDAPRTTRYTCPMHPQIIRDAPGNCPICGMTLEPLLPDAGQEEEDLELRHMTRRFWVGAVLSAALLLVVIGLRQAEPTRLTDASPTPSLGVADRDLEVIADLDQLLAYEESATWNDSTGF